MLRHVCEFWLWVRIVSVAEQKASTNNITYPIAKSPSYTNIVPITKKYIYVYVRKYIIVHRTALLVCVHIVSTENLDERKEKQIRCSGFSSIEKNNNKTITHKKTPIGRFVFVHLGRFLVLRLNCLQSKKESCVCGSRAPLSIYSHRWNEPKHINRRT